MNLPLKLMFATILGMALSLAVVLATPEITNETATAALGHGYVHQNFSSMRQGGDGDTRIDPIRWSSVAFGVFALCFFFSCFAVGLTGGHKVQPLNRSLVVMCIANLAIFITMVLVYWQYARGTSEALWLGFAPPTAIMIYGLWFFPILYAVFFVRVFRRDIWSADQEREFKEILEKRGRS